MAGFKKIASIPCFSISLYECAKPSYPASISVDLRVAMAPVINIGINIDIVLEKRNYLLSARLF